MPKTRLPIRFRRGGPWLALGVAATLVALPGVASADAGSGVLPGSSAGSVPGPGGDLLNQVSGQASQGSGGSGTSSGTSASQQQNAATQGTTASGAPGLPSPPPQFQALLDQLQPSQQCQDAVKADLTKLLTDIPSLVQAVIAQLTSQLSPGSPPPSPQQILDQLKGALGQAQKQQAAAADSTSPSPSPDPTVIANDLQQLATDLSTKCAPPPPSGQGSTPTSPSSPSTQQPQTQEASQPTTQPATQPVKYPGYAATGGIATTALRPAGDQRSSDPVPLSVLGGVLLVSTATAVGVRARVRRGGR